MKKLYCTGLLILVLGATPVGAVTPCNPDPCTDLSSAVCQQAAGRVIDAELIEIRYESVEVPYPDQAHSGIFQTVPTAFTFLAINPPGMPGPRRAWHLIPASRCWPVPGLSEMRPKKLRLAVRPRREGDLLVHYKAVP